MTTAEMERGNAQALGQIAPPVTPGEPPASELTAEPAPNFSNDLHHAAGPAYVGVHAGRLIFVVMHDEAAFDAINVEERDHIPDGDPNSSLRVRTKAIERHAGSPLDVIFQFWPNSALSTRTAADA